MQNRANSPVTDEVRMAIADEVFKLRCLLEQKENQLTSQINLKMTKEVEQTKTDIKNLNSNIGLLDSLRKQN